MDIDKNKPFMEMTPDEMSKVIQQVKEEMPKERGRPRHKEEAVRLRGYLPGKNRDRFMKCMTYSYNNGWIGEEKVYAFTNWCVERIITAIEDEMSHNPKFSPLKDSQT